MKKFRIALIALYLLTTSILSAIASEVVCKVSTNTSENTGWCVESVTGVVDCWNYETSGADRCSDTVIIHGSDNPEFN